MRASSSDRALICPASLVRKQTQARTANAIKAAEWGTLVHAWKEGQNAEHKTLTKKLAATAVDREKLWPTGVGDTGRHEVTFSICLETLQLRVWSPTGSKFNRDQWKRRHPRHRYLTGSIDWLSRIRRPGSADLRPWVDDLKTGAWPVYAKKSDQLRSYALVPWIIADCNTDVWASITHWPKYPIAGKPRRNWARFTSAQLETHVNKLRWTVANTDIANPNVEGCRFCLCKPNCNEYQESDFN